MFEQAVIAASGALAIALVNADAPHLRRAGCLVGLAGQPFWLYATVTAGQWGMFVLSCWYTGAWAWGAWRHHRAARAARAGAPVGAGA